VPTSFFPTSGLSSGHDRKESWVLQGRKGWNRGRARSWHVTVARLPSPWRLSMSYTSEEQRSRHARMWLKGRAKPSAGSVGTGANIVSVCCAAGSLPAEECKWQKEVASSPGRKELQPLSLSVWAVGITSQQKQWRSTTHLARELSMGKKGQNRNGLTGQIAVSSLRTALSFFFWYDSGFGP